ncbi:hypothetical protein [Saccharicrinis sp. FJH54]|uniref:hypothetical protein n=1 Tax=Saccharicrinis sp. FJH54 TaxID=3344665 RepID=UPI0035D424E5
MNGSKKSKTDILYQSGLRINNSLSDADIKQRVADYGYTVAVLNQGKALLDEAAVLYPVIS